MSKIKEDPRPLGSKRSWAQSNGTYLAGQAAIDGADAVALAMELRWGSGRLRLLVPTDLRERFDRQRFKFNAAVWHGDLITLQQESERMIKAWQALERAAEAAGSANLNPSVWEVALADGTVAALVRTPEEAHAVVREGRQVVVYTLEELARLLDNYREIVMAKEAFPGATVEQIRRDISDPLADIRGGQHLDDRLNDDLPILGN